MAFYLEENTMYVSYKIIRLKPLTIYLAVRSRSQVKWQVIESYRRKHKNLCLESTCITAFSGIIVCNSKVVFAVTMRQIL
jgi:predicted transcriptional regulator of viral defense system